VRRLGSRVPRALGTLLLAGVILPACARRVVEPLQLVGAHVIVTNDTAEEWHDVELWLNSYFRAIVSSIPAHGRYDVPMTAFVSGYGQRFDFSHMQIRGLRLVAKRPDGSPFELNKKFDEGGLAGALGGER